MCFEEHNITKKKRR